MFGDDDEIRTADREPWILTRRLLDPSGDHDAHVHTVGHVVRIQRLLNPGRQFLPTHPDIHADRGRTLPQSIEMFVEEHEHTVVQSQSLPHAVTDEIPTVEDGDLRILSVLQFAVDVDPHIRVARIGESVVCSVCHRVVFSCGKLQDAR